MNRKPIFDALVLPGRSYSQGEVDEINGAIKRAMEPSPRLHESAGNRVAA
jgi:hypothetical protein